MRQLHLIVEPVLGGPLVDGVKQPALFQVGEGALVAERAGELCLAVREPGERAHEPHPQIGECVEIQRAPLRRPDQLGRRNPPCADDVVDLVVSLVVQPGAVHPPQDVLAAIDARHADMLADRKRHRPAGAMNLVRDLNAGRGRAHHQHAAIGQGRGPRVIHRRRGFDGARQVPPRRAESSAR